ncbi:MAG: BON domain-containing protein [Rhizobacter sp.]
MNTKLISACFVAAGLLTSFVVRAEDGNADRKHPVAFVKDSAITTKVKAKLAADKVGSLTQIHVDTDKKGMVVLTGTAKTQESVDNAERIARETEGVTSVQNNIKVK